MTGFRVLRLLDGIGPSSAGKVLDRMAGRRPLDALLAIRPPVRAAEGWRALLALMQRLRSKGCEWPEEIEEVRRWYQPYFEQRYEDALVRGGDLDQLQRIAAGYPSRAKFLTDLTLDPPSATSDEAGPPLRDEDYPSSNIHSAKGQEWRAVFVLNVVGGCIPSELATGTADDIEEDSIVPTSRLITL